MSTKSTVARLVLLVCVSLSTLLVPPSASSYPAAFSSERAAAARSTDVLIAPPRPPLLPRRGCASVKFPWAVATTLTDTRIHAGITIYRNGAEVDSMSLSGMYANRWYTYSVYACQPGRYTARVFGEIRKLSTGDWEVLANLRGARSFSIQRRR